MFNSNAWNEYYYTWPNVNMPHCTFKMNFIENINIRLVGT